MTSKLGNNERGIIMNKEAILEMSKQENKGQDLANLEISKSGMQIGWVLAICLLAVISVTEAIIYSRVNNGVFFSVMAGCASVFMYKYIKLHKKHELIISVIYGIASICFLVAWIISLSR